MSVVVQIYGRKKCQTTRKAQRFFSERRVNVQNVDLGQYTPGAREIELFLAVAGSDQLIDVDGGAYRKKGLAYMEFDAAEEILSNPELLRTPVVRSGRDVVVGDDEAGWERIAAGERS